MPRAAPGLPCSPAGCGTGPGCEALPCCPLGSRQPALPLTLSCTWGLVMAVQSAALRLPEQRPGACPKAPPSARPSSALNSCVTPPVCPRIPISSVAPSHFPPPAQPHGPTAASHPQAPPGALTTNPRLHHVPQQHPPCGNWGSIHSDPNPPSVTCL